MRSIVTHPTDSRRDRLPAILFVQWLSCDPVTVSPTASDGWQDILRALIQLSGMIVARTEKPGLGGSGGPACAELGYDEEVAVHRAVHALMPDHVRFHSAYLGEVRTPSQIVRGWSGASAVWRRMIGTDTLFRHQYGRSVRFHHEAQRQNWPRMWAAVTAPVLVLHGEYDWVIPEAEHMRILRSLSPQALVQTTYVELRRMGHDFMVYPSLENSFRARNGGFDGLVADTIIGWLWARRER